MLLTSIVWAGLLLAEGPQIGVRVPVLFRENNGLLGAAIDQAFGASTTLVARPAQEEGLRLERCPDEVYWSCAARSASQAPYLLAIVSDPLPVSLVLLDVKSALERYGAVDRSLPDWEHRVEAEIRAQALLTERGSFSTPTEQAALLQRMLNAARPLLLARGHWAPNGALEVAGAPPGLRLQIDGQDFGTTTGSALTIEALRLGPHQLSFSEPHGIWADTQATVEIRPGGPTRYQAELESGPNSAPTARTLTLLGGIALTAGGAALLTWSIVAPAAEQTVLLCSTECQAQAGGFRRSSELLGPGPPRGPLVGPLGYSLMATGVGFALGSVTIGEEWELPWLGWLIGLGVGGLSYGLSELFSSSPS